MRRLLQEEWLDTLPDDDPRAIRSRRDLRRINRLMGNDRIVARALREAHPEQPPARLVDLGAGDGYFWAGVARHLHPTWPNCTRLILLDRMAASPTNADGGLCACGWHVERICANALDWHPHPGPPGTALVMNLFLHHFDAEQIRALFLAWAQWADTVVICEPRRSRVAVAAASLLGLIGANAVTRHDAAVSVRAGFRDHEIAEHWPVASGWRVREGRAGLFSHGFVAQRNRGT
jgi:hypothetical protein